VAAAVQRATMLGGRVLVTPRAARFGRLAVIADPSGAPIGLLQWARTGASPGS
jgi:predicted enzyme related to lactoylglutathione lyase